MNTLYVIANLIATFPHAVGKWTFTYGAESPPPSPPDMAELLPRALRKIAEFTAIFPVFLNGANLHAVVSRYRTACIPFGHPRVAYRCPCCKRILDSHDPRFKRNRLPRRVLCDCIKAWVVIQE